MAKKKLICETSTVGQASLVRSLNAFPTGSLAALMVDAYRGTVDWEEGDDEFVAAQEITQTMSGHYGEFIDFASGCLADETGKPTSAVFVVLNEGVPMIAFAMTAKNHSGKGLATKLIRNAAHELRLRGFEQMELFVTHGNPAQSLYERLGFTEVLPSD